MKHRSCLWRKVCRNGNNGCYSAEPKNCVRFLPLDGTNLTEISGVIETPPEIDSDKFSQYFSNWIDSMGWSFCGFFGPYTDEDQGGADI